MKDWKIVVAFDTDDTLLIPNIAMDESIRVMHSIWYSEDYIEPAWYKHWQNVYIYDWYKKSWCYMIVWSWTGTWWAEKWAKEFGLEYDEIREKKKYDDIDISVDDCVVDLAKLNIKVKRVNNQISRKEWNRNKR